MTNDHVFLFTADGLRHDRLSYNGYEVETTPTLDSLVESGAASNQAIVTGTGTRKSFPGILTSSYPLMYGGYAQLSEHRTTLASAFGDAGYTTLGVNANAQLHSRFGWDRGFDVYFDSEQTVVNEEVGSFRAASDAGAAASPFRRGFDSLKTAIYERLDQNGPLFRVIESAYRLVEDRAPPHPTADEIVDLTLEFVDKAPSDRTLFVFAHFMETHSPYVPPAKYREEVGAPDVTSGDLWNINDRLHTNPGSLSEEEVEILSAMYDASLRQLDDELERLFAGLQSRGLWDDSHVAFTSDHGEQFREHGDLTHCIEPYEEGAHVPMVFKLGTADIHDVEKVTSTIDIGPTLLEAAVDDHVVPDRFHGLSLHDELQGNDSLPNDRTVFIQHANRSGRDVDLDQRITGCRTTEWKFITSRSERASTKLFHLPSDPSEQTNLAESEPERVAEFEEIIASHYDQPAYTDFSIENAIDTGVVGERLEALGYVDD